MSMKLTRISIFILVILTFVLSGCNEHNTNAEKVEFQLKDGTTCVALVSNYKASTSQVRDIQFTCDWK